MFYCICLPHIIFHRGNSVAIQPHCTSQQLNHHHSTNHATHSKVNHVQDFYMFYKAIIIALCGLRGAPALPCGRRWNAVPTGSILLFVAEYRNADHSDSCLFVSRAGGHSCPAKRCAPRGWRWFSWSRHRRQTDSTPPMAIILSNIQSFENITRKNNSGSRFAKRSRPVKYAPKLDFSPILQAQIDRSSPSIHNPF